ncbi:tRNA (5-methylaminomethyl-2-thiouridine)(34)-methyltransferase MnmD [Pedobacter sp. SAFR-022]|uniref:tRNA (5-methylaminomethyl-2-thiouridine)(34)-methyltransferase MnmD n=1 Tax=Pedobacter sp. SAFR-022 TaxID=3436861 RepID=UPI003F81ACBD
MNKIILTEDGSKTLFNETIGEHYHSTRGALQESKHVFLQAGLLHTSTLFPQQEISILEVGFGTGLNFLLSMDYALEHRVPVRYTGIEAFPITEAELQATDYQQYVAPAVWKAYSDHYSACIDNRVELMPGLSLEIVQRPLAEVSPVNNHHLVYYDAFSLQYQPEMWSNDIIEHTTKFLRPGGVFVTYAITGNLKRALTGFGFKVEKLVGAPGKRQMLRATKL